MNRQTVRRQLESIGRDVGINTWLSSAVWPGGLRTTILRQIGFRGIDPTARIYPRVFLGSRRLTMGPGSSISYGCFLDLGAAVNLGKNCVLSYGCMLITCSHSVGTPDRRVGPETYEPITIGDGCWLGARVTVLPGVTIGEGCVIASGSVVSRDCAPNGLYVGSSARRVRDLPGSEDRQRGGAAIKNQVAPD